MGQKEIDKYADTKLSKEPQKSVEEQKVTGWDIFYIFIAISFVAGAVEGDPEETNYFLWVLGLGFLIRAIFGIGKMFK